MGRMTVPVGVSQGPQHAMNPRELIACAEAAMMTAKARGKNQVVLYDDGVGERPESPAGRDVRSIAHLKMLQSLAGKLNRLNDLGQIGETIASELRLLIDYHNCRVFLREDDDDLVPIAFLGDFEDHAGTTPLDAYRTKVGVGVTGRVAETGVSLPCRTRSSAGSPTGSGHRRARGDLAAVPLRYGSRVTGAIVISKLGINQFDEDDVRLRRCSRARRPSARNGAPDEAQRREAEGAKALLAFLADVSHAQSFDEICERTVATAASLFETEAASLWLQDERTGDFARAASHGLNLPAEGVLGRGVRRAPVLEHREPFRGEEALVAPLLSGDGVTGWIAVVKEHPQRVPDSELRLLAAFSFQASVALQKARLYWQQQEAAEIANALLDAGRELATAETADDVLRRSVEVTAARWRRPRVDQDGTAATLMARASDKDGID
jgi:GAF domain-containing protein